MMDALLLSVVPWVGLVSTGPGIAGYKSWIVAVLVMGVLLVLAWWTWHPTRRATRAEVRRARRGDGDGVRDFDDPNQS